MFSFFFQAEDGIRVFHVTGVQTCALPILPAEGSLTYVHDPHDPVPTVGGALLMAGSPDGGLSYQPGSRDQRVLDGRSDKIGRASCRGERRSAGARASRREGERR